MRVIVRTICTAVVKERLVIDMPDGTDINRQSFNGAGGWAEAIEQGRVTVMRREITSVDDERDHEVTFVIDRTEEAALASTG